MLRLIDRRNRGPWRNFDAGQQAAVVDRVLLLDERGTLRELESRRP